MFASIHPWMLQRSMFRNPQIVQFSDVTSINDVCDRGGQIWLGCNGGKVKKSTDRGATWTTYDLNALVPGGWSVDVQKVFGSHGFFLGRWHVWGGTGKHAYTDDGGATWVSQDIASPAFFLLDVEDTGGYLIGGGIGGYYQVNVSGDFSSASAVGVSPIRSVSRDYSDVTHILVGDTSNYYVGLFGWPPPAGHLSPGTYPKGSTGSTVAATFDGTKGLYMVNSDGSVGYKVQPGYSITAPAWSTPASLVGAVPVALEYASDTTKMAIAGVKSGQNRIWMANANTGSAPAWTEYDPYAEYSGLGISWSAMERDTTNGRWLTVGSTSGSQGILGLWTI